MIYSIFLLKKIVEIHFYSVIYYENMRALSMVISAHLFFFLSVVQIIQLICARAIRIRFVRVERLGLSTVLSTDNSLLQLTRQLHLGQKWISDRVFFSSSVSDTSRNRCAFNCRDNLVKSLLICRTNKTRECCISILLILLSTFFLTLTVVTPSIYFN